MKEIYNEDFYKTRHKDTLHSAETVLRLVQNVIPQINSIVEFGCGVGTWLYVLKEQGAETILGLDGSWVPQEFRVISQDDFISSDFEKSIKLDKRYDLAISLEVAEHISKENAMQFVESLTNASDYCLFSAAIPGQGGDAHVNEQWPKYWADLFNEKGYICYDFIRERIWEDNKIPPWYKQNILLFAKVDSNVNAIEKEPLSLVHPDTFCELQKKNIELRERLQKEGIMKSILRKIKKYLKNI